MSHRGIRVQRHAAAVIALLTLSACSYGQPAPGVPLSAAIEQIQEEQRQLAARAGITVFHADNGWRSSSRIEGVPLEFRNRAIRNETDARGISRLLGPYYGFTGTESLELDSVIGGIDETSYVFRQFIDGIEAASLLSIWVDDETLLITRLLGSLDIDTDLERFPPMDEQAAIELVLEYIDESNLDANYYVIGGAHFGERIYRHWGSEQPLAPGWRIHIEREKMGQSDTHDEFLVSPDGKVSIDAIVTN